MQYDAPGRDSDSFSSGNTRGGFSGSRVSRQNLFASERSPSGQRQYPDSAVDRVQLIQQLYAAGLPSKSIADLLPCVVNGAATPELIDRLSAEGDRIDSRIGDLVGFWRSVPSGDCSVRSWSRTWYG
ncbi:MerR family transcriptional regulator [Streptomyces sp. NPDC002324]